VHEPYLFDFSSVQNTPATSPRPDLTPDTPLLPSPVSALAKSAPVAYPPVQQYTNSLLTSEFGAAPPPVPFPDAPQRTELPHKVGLGVDPQDALATAEAAGPLATLLTSFSSPSSSTISLPSTSTGGLSWDELTLGTSSPLKTTFVSLPPPDEAPFVFNPSRAKDESFKANPFGFTEEMVKGEVLTTASVELGDLEGRRKVEEERRRRVWKETCLTGERATVHGRSFAEVARAYETATRM
jgi:hypothetical protein